MKLLRVAFVHPVNVPGMSAKTSFSKADDHLTMTVRSGPDGVSIANNNGKPGQGDTFVPMANIISIGFESDAPAEKGKAK